MRIIFLGTPEFSLPTLEALHQSKHEIIGIISQPDKIQDRGKKIVFSPVKEFAMKNDLNLMQFDKISRDMKLNKLLYQIAKEMLHHRSGTLYEDMYWIDLTSLKIVAKEITTNVEESIIYSKKQKR